MAKETTTKKTTTKKSTKAKEVATPEVATTVASPEANVSSADRTVADKLIALSRLQETFTKIDHIKTLRGELPLEVQDLEDEIEGMETRLKHLEEDNKRQVQAVATEKAKIQKAEERIEEYKEQLNNVKNNREYDTLTTSPRKSNSKALRSNSLRSVSPKGRPRSSTARSVSLLSRKLSVSTV